MGEGVLAPVERCGRENVLIVAAASKFMGVRFSELSFSILVTQPEAGGSRDAAFLVQAFNSCRIFSFCERTFFATPYRHGDVRVAASFPPSIDLIQGNEV